MSQESSDEQVKLSKKEKRKRSQNSSTSDLDTSIDSKTSTATPKSNREKKKQKKLELEKLKEQTSENMDEKDQDISAQLKEINKKLENVITKDDKSLTALIRETFSVMKDELLKSVSHRLDILEGKLFEKEQENVKLREKIESLEKVNEKNKDDQSQSAANENKENVTFKAEINLLEQYGRRNNIRIDGIADNRYETAEQTGQKVAECLNALIPKLHIRRCDIDIAHRLKKKNEFSPRPRQIIVKFVSRFTRDTVLQNKSLLTRERVFVNEDLTKLNAHVLTCIRKKLPTEVDSSWSINGRLFFKNKAGSVHEVKYQDFNHWIKMDWLEEKSDGKM